MKSFDWKNAVVLAVILAASAGFSPVVFSEQDTEKTTVQDRPVYKEKVAELKKLKEENPAEFERVVKERKEKLKERLQDMKQNDPEKYEQVKEKMIHNRKEKLKELQEKNPERYEEFIKNHPKAADRLEDRRDHREDVRDRREDVKDNSQHRGDIRGVRDHGQGIGRGKGQGGQNRSTSSVKGGSLPGRSTGASGEKGSGNRGSRNKA